MYDVYVNNSKYTLGTYSTLKKAINKAQSTGKVCSIFRTNNPFAIIKHVFPKGGIK